MSTQIKPAQRVLFYLQASGGSVKFHTLQHLLRIPRTTLRNAIDTLRRNGDIEPAETPGWWRAVRK